MKKWFRDAFLPRYRRCQRELTSFVQWTREKVMRVVNSAVDPILLAGFFLFSWLAYDTYSGLGELGEDESARVLEWLKFYAYLVGGIVLIWQVRISNRRAAALEKTAALGEKGNITERFKNAIEHLTHASESVRIGGIHTLYHIAKEASEYRETVVSILSTHLRETLAKADYTPRIRINRDGNWAKKDKMPTGEVMAILRAFFPSLEDGKKPPLLFEYADLSELDLSGALLSWLRMDNVYADGVNLSKADLSYSHLVGVDMSHAKLTSVFLPEANLEEAVLIDSHFWGALICGANLAGAMLHGSNFTYANLNGANLEGADAHNAVFDKATCMNADFSGAELESATFQGTNLREAVMKGAVITADQLLEAKTLYCAELDYYIREEIMRQKPELLLDPPTEDPPDEEEE